MSESYEGRQFVGMDLHRRRSVLVRTTETGEHLEAVRIANDRDLLAQVLERAGERPEVVLEATYGWYWAADALAELGAVVHLAHPLGVKAFEYRRVKNDQRDAADLADLLRMGRLPEAWIAPPVTRELRELVRHRAKLVATRTRCKAEVHAILAKCGVAVPMSDLFGVEGTALLDTLALPGPFRARLHSLRRLLEALDFEITLFEKITRARLVRDPGYRAVQQLPGIGAVLAAVLVAEIGDVHRFAARAAGVVGRADTAALRVRHHRAPGPGHQTGLAAGAVGGHRIGADPAQDHPHRRLPRPDRHPPRQPQHRRGRRRPQTTRPCLLRTARSHYPRGAATRSRRMNTPLHRPTRIVQVMTPASRRSRPPD